MLAFDALLINISSIYDEKAELGELDPCPI
jgi:hypothetical protein